MNKLFIACFITLISFIVRAQTPLNEEVYVLVKIHSVKDAETQLGLPIVFENQEHSKKLLSLSPDDEVLLKGHLTYHQTKSDGKLTMSTKFHIESIHPISLKRLGITEVPSMEPRMTFTSKVYPGPEGLQVSPEIAGAITFTASALLLQNLSETANTQPLKYQMDRAMFISTGVLATGYFIWKQISEKKK